MQIYLYQAECGDAARIYYLGSDNRPHNIFIDAGYQRTYRHVLSQEIRRIEEIGEAIDVWIITHIHDDHLGGVVKYIQAIQDGDAADIVKSWYYNAPRLPTHPPLSTKTSLISTATSIRNADTLVDYLVSRENWKKFDITNQLPVQDCFGLHLTILSPNPEKLTRLREKYSIGAEADLVAPISEATAAKGHDYQVPIEAFDLTLQNWKEDVSIENGSSIAVLTEYGAQRMLWLSDAHPSVVVESLKSLGYSKEHPLICDWVKITHHGSKANNSNELYALIRCCHYVLSVNGENRDYLLAKECIARIIRNTNRFLESFYHFYFTHDNSTLRSIFSIDGEDTFTKWNFQVHFPEAESKWIKFS